MQPSRRQVLTAGAAALVSACTADRQASPRAPDPDLALLDAAEAREESLIAAYAAVMRVQPTLTPALAPLLGDHAAHLGQLRASRTAAPTPSPAPTQPPAPTTLAGLVALERTVGAQHATAATTASRSLAPLLASLAACEASHVAVLA